MTTQEREGIRRSGELETHNCGKPVHASLCETMGQTSKIEYRVGRMTERFRACGWMF